MSVLQIVIHVLIVYLTLISIKEHTTCIAKTAHACSSIVCNYIELQVQYMIVYSYMYLLLCHSFPSLCHPMHCM